MKKNSLKMGKNQFYVVILANFEKSTRTHQYAFQNLMEMLYGMHRYSRKKNWACWSMVRFWPCGLSSGLLTLIFFIKIFFQMLNYPVALSTVSPPVRIFVPLIPSTHVFWDRVILGNFYPNIFCRILYVFWPTKKKICQRPL